MAANTSANNNLTKVDAVIFNESLELFEDELQTASLLPSQLFNPVMQQRSSIDGGANNPQSLGERWVPVNIIGQVVSGEVISASDQSSLSQLAVPFSIDQARTAALKLSFRDGQDPVQLKRQLTAQVRQLATEINKVAITKLAYYGTSCVSYNGAFDGYNALARARTKFQNIGIATNKRMALISPDAYNTASGNLASRQTIDKSNVEPALRKAYLGDIAGWETYENPVGSYLAGANGPSNLTVDLSAGSTQHYVPSPSTYSLAGSIQQNDNRFQTVTFSAALTGVKAGDTFVLGTAGSSTAVLDIHALAKTQANTLATFRIVSVSGSTAVITPPIISNAGNNSNSATKSYQNCAVQTLAANIPVVWVNKTSTFANVVFDGETSVSLDYGMYPVESIQMSGIGVMQEATPRLNIPILFTKQADSLGATISYTWRLMFGINVPNPMGVGVVFDNQS